MPDATPEADCAICLEPLPRTCRAVLPCDHAFHVACVNALTRTSSRCPICRADFAAALEPPDRGPADAEDAPHADGVAREMQTIGVLQLVCVTFRHTGVRVSTLLTFAIAVASVFTSRPAVESMGLLCITGVAIMHFALHLVFPPRESALLLDVATTCMLQSLSVASSASAKSLARAAQRAFQLGAALARGTRADAAGAAVTAGAAAGAAGRETSGGVA